LSIARAVTRWVVLGLLLATLLDAARGPGPVHATTGRSATPVPGAAGRSRARAGPRLGAGGSSPGRRSGRRIALTFDDGPIPRWTPRIAAELRALHVPATFFVVGSEVVRHPDLVRQPAPRRLRARQPHVHARGRLALPGWEQRLQIGLTDNALAGTVGIRPRLFRPPYSSVPGGVSAVQARAYERLALDGYDVVLTDFDGEDWRRPGVDSIVASVTPQGKRGGIVLLHDGGGDRSQTVRAIGRLVPALRARGFRFVTVSRSRVYRAPRRRFQSIAGGVRGGGS
jgi:peptidoglycan/xylan/chitin deacetylase (PgdA/CDA1 family)